jgi:hypothetical protein
MSVLYPNKLFLCKFRTDYYYSAEHLLIIAAENKELVNEYLYDKYRVKIDPIQLINCGYETIYNNSGNKPLEKQLKIIINENRIIK